MATKKVLKKFINEIDTEKEYTLEQLVHILTTKYNKVYKISEQLCVFTDGACSNNGKKNARAGYAVIFPYLQELNYSTELKENPTNNRAEYNAVIDAIKIANMHDSTYQRKLFIYTDSDLLIKSVTIWIKNWKKNGWKTANKKDVLNKDLLLILDSLMQTREIEFIHVEAHTNKNDWKSYWNDIADKEARKTISSNIKNASILQQLQL